MCIIRIFSGIIVVVYVKVLPKLFLHKFVSVSFSQTVRAVCH